MKLIRTERDLFVFHLERPEKLLLTAVLDQFPLLPGCYQPLSKSGSTDSPDANQQLLDEALAEQRRQHRRRVDALLENPQRWTPHEAGFQITLSGSELEWLLQVLNDLRVGSWIRLGSPEQELESIELNETNARDLWLMELAGVFETMLLEAWRQP